LSSKGSTWDEIDFGVLGNLSGDNYILRTKCSVKARVQEHGVPFPKNQPIRIYSSLWNADHRTTRGLDGSINNAWFSQEMDSAKVAMGIENLHDIYNYRNDIKGEVRCAVGCV
ncbi:hypothetical protein Golob_011353, partial [Gossypium lobatum]|nr:hypothetical protein [Gossypium lobatum]